MAAEKKVKIRIPKKRKEYDFEKETGYAWADRRDAFLSGGVSGEQMKKWLADIEEGRSDSRTTHGSTRCPSRKAWQ